MTSSVPRVRRAKAAALRAIGAVPALVDVYDADKLKLAVYAVQPDVIIHQLTDLPQVIDPKTMPAALAANARLRIAGTRNLVDAALTNGVARDDRAEHRLCLCAGRGPADRGSSDRSGADRRDCAGGCRDEDARHRRRRAALWPALRSGHLDATRRTAQPRLHVDAAAQAALLALTKGAPGIYNIAEDDGAVSSEKARRGFGFDASFRIGEEA